MARAYINVAMDLKIPSIKKNAESQMKFILHNIP